MPREPELEGGVDLPKGIMAFYQLRMEELREVLRKAGSLTAPRISWHLLSEAKHFLLS